MPSNLRIQTSIEEPIATGYTRSYSPPSSSSSSSSSPLSPKQRQKKMSLTQTYYIAASARSKLGREARRPDHDLRLLVGHANLLDTLMLELADAEREQEAWFNQTVHKAAKAESAPRHIQWLDTAAEEEDDEDSSDVESDADEDFQMEDFEIVSAARPRARNASPPPAPQIRIDETELSDEEDEDEDEEIEYFDDENDAEHALVRTPSQQSPPELILDDISDDSEDDDVASPPASPPQSSEMPYLERQKKLSDSEQEAFAKDGFFIPQRPAPAIPMVASY